MDRTTFAGLTRLAPDDPLTTDDASFLRRNISVIDFFLALGAINHRHDAHVALGNPSVMPTVVASASGGTIDPGVTGYFGYTLLDSDGGETTVSPLGSASTPQPFAAPALAPSGAAEYTGGTLRADTYYYGVSLMDGLGGETTISPFRSVTRDPGFASGQIRLSGLDQLVGASPGSTGWGVYRSQGGGQWYYLASGVAPTFLDDGTLCADCGRQPPITNTTRRTTKFRVTLPGGLAGTGIRLYGGQDSNLSDPALVGTYPIASAGATLDVPSMNFATGTPPPVSMSKGGARQLNPSLELAATSPTLVGLGSGMSYPAGWASASVTLTAGEVLLDGALASGSASGVIASGVIGVVPATFRPSARRALDAVTLGTPRARAIYDVLPDGRIILMEPASGAVSMNGRWRL